MGGKRIDRPGSYMQPTILTDIKPDNPAFRDEFFGPVALFFRVKNEDEAIALANDSDFGLGGSVWTKDVARGKRVASRVETGMMFINNIDWSDAELPFGGIKNSGYGRELGDMGIQEFVNKKLVRTSTATRRRNGCEHDSVDIRRGTARRGSLRRSRLRRFLALSGRRERPMYVNVAVLKETQPHERRVALVPSVVAKADQAGRQAAHAVRRRRRIQLAGRRLSGRRLHRRPQGAGRRRRRGPRRSAAGAGGDRRHEAGRDPDLLRLCRATSRSWCKRLLAKKITCFAMERIPRISRAQAMDALSSQSALAGYYAVALGMTHMAGVLPKITSAAGVIGPAKVLVMGLGVAGLEAIATAQRLGAVVEGYDVRPETKEQALSLAPPSSTPASTPPARAATPAR